MQNSLQASRSLYVGHVAAFCKAKPTKKTHSLKETKHPCRKCIFSWVVCYSMSRHNVKIIEENTFLTIGMHYVLNCFVWNAAWPSHNHTHSCMIGAKPCNIRPFATPPHMRYPLSRKKTSIKIIKCYRENNHRLPIIDYIAICIAIPWIHCCHVKCSRVHLARSLQCPLRWGSDPGANATEKRAVGCHICLCACEIVYMMFFII